jgi:hypothetical protein
MLMLMLPLPCGPPLAGSEALLPVLLFAMLRMLQRDLSLVGTQLSCWFRHQMLTAEVSDMCTLQRDNKHAHVCHRV